MISLISATAVRGTQWPYRRGTPNSFWGLILISSETSVMETLEVTLSIFLCMSMRGGSLVLWRIKSLKSLTHIFWSRSISDKSNKLFLFNISCSSKRQGAAAGTSESCTADDELGFNDWSYSICHASSIVWEEMEGFLLWIWERRCFWPFLNNSFPNSQRPRTIFRNPYIISPINYINIPSPCCSSLTSFNNNR